MHIHNNSVLHYLYNIEVSLVIYSKVRAFKAKAKAKAKTFNIPNVTTNVSNKTLK